MSSDFNLLQMNVWLGLVRGDHALPRHLYELGYRDRAIERGFPNSAMEQVCPELIIASRANGHTIALEFKSGANTDADQLRRYGDIESANFRRAYLEPAECQAHDITIVGRVESRDRLRIGLVDGGYPFPLLLMIPEGLALDLHVFVKDEVTDVFSPLLEIDWDRAPTSYMPFDQDSESWQIAESILPVILSKMLKRDPRITFDQICQELTPWGILGQEGRQQVVARVSAVLNFAADREFREFFTCDRTGVRIDSNPLEIGSSRRTAAFQRLQRLQADLIERLKAAQLELEIPD